jgi:hypothetical protein
LKHLVTFSPQTQSVDGLQYTNLGWERELDCRQFHVQRKRRWFRSDQWAVFRFAGADTAAIGGGAVWFDRVSPWYDSEQRAIRFMMGINKADDDVYVKERWVRVA